MLGDVGDHDADDLGAVDDIDDEGCGDCADEGTTLDGPGTLFRALLAVEPAAPAFASALWRGVAASHSLDHLADSLTQLPPEPR